MQESEHIPTVQPALYFRVGLVRLGCKKLVFHSQEQVVKSKSAALELQMPHEVDEHVVEQDASPGAQKAN